MLQHYSPRVWKVLGLASGIAWSSLGGVWAVELVSLQKDDAQWSDGTAWSLQAVPTESNQRVVVNAGKSVTVDSAFNAPVQVVVGNSQDASPDGRLLITADFEVATIEVAVMPGSSGSVQQTGGAVMAGELHLASTHPDSTEAVYNLDGGNLSVQVVKMGVMGPGILSMRGNGEVVAVRKNLLIGNRGEIRFIGGKAGFPSINPGNLTIDSGAVVSVEVDETGAAPGKYTLVQADKPLASSFQVNLVGFGGADATILEGENGLVLEVK